MERKIIHVIGTGTIGEPLIGLLCDYRDQLGIDGITFKKEVASETDKSKVIDLIKRGARLVTDQDKINEFKKLNLDPAFESDEAIKRATVVIDCSTKSNQISSKKEYYNDFKNDVKGFIIQGDQNGFGKKYAYGINDSALDQSDKFIKVISCNSHNISSITNTLALSIDPDNLIDGKFVCIRRANDISQDSGFIPSPQVNMHLNERYGSHHAKDSVDLFRTLGMELNLFSSEMRINSQYMHVLWFNLKVREPTSLQKVKSLLESNNLIAMTSKDMTSSVFSFGRDHGHYGRILNQAVVVEKTLNVKNDHEIVGFCFTPSDGNSIFSSISAAEWFLYPHSFKDKLSCFDHLFFDKI